MPQRCTVWWERLSPNRETASLRILADDKVEEVEWFDQACKEFAVSNATTT